jgi:hypothetical protein
MAILHSAQSERIGRWVLVALVACLGVQPVDGAAPAPPRVRDVWYVYVAGQQRWGYEHLTVRRENHDRFRYESETRLLLDVLGQRQEMSEKAKYMVTATYEPVSLDVQTSTLAGASRLVGKVEKGSLVLTRQREGPLATAVVPLAAGLLLPACVDDWLSGQPAGTRQAAFRVLNDAAMKDESATATRQPGDPAVWDVDMGPELGRRQLQFDAEGIRRLLVSRMPPQRIERTTAEQARKIRHRTIEGRELLQFPVGKPIAAPERLNFLTVRLTWQGIPFDQFHLEDERQQVVRRTEKGGHCEAVLRIHAAALPASQLSFPVPGAEYRPWLAATNYIRPADPDIVRQGRQWIGGEKTALGAVRALSAAVFRHMRGGTMIAETLSGPEALRTRKGKCSEYAVLFASLARSAGIPARIVLGTRLVGDYWVGHMWNEAYVGRWITVDSTVDEVGGSPALLKLTHSESVMGTASLRWRLTESLDVAVEEFDPPATAPPADLKTGIEGPVYTNAALACRIAAPEGTWRVKDASKPNIPVTIIQLNPPRRDDVSMYFVPMSVPSVFTPAALLEFRAARLKQIRKGYEVLAQRDYVFNRISGRMPVSRWTGMGKGAGMTKETAVMWSDGTSCYLLTLIADEKSHGAYSAAFFGVLDSFQSLRRATATGAGHGKPGDPRGASRTN